jgi:hypothetical protein
MAENGTSYGLMGAKENLDAKNRKNDHQGFSTITPLAGTDAGLTLIANPSPSPP